MNAMAWKVVKRRHDVLTSVAHSHFNLQVTYRPSEWTRPVVVGSLLFACGNYADARRIAKINRKWFDERRMTGITVEIWLCEVENHVFTKFRLTEGPLEAANDVAKVWLFSQWVIHSRSCSLEWGRDVQTMARPALCGTAVRLQELAWSDAKTRTL